MTDASQAPKSVPVESHCSKSSQSQFCLNLQQTFLIVLYEPSSLLATDDEAVDNMSSFIQDVYILLGREAEAKETDESPW